MSFYTFLISRFFLFLILFFCINVISAQSIDSADVFTINSISILGNRKTKDKIIIRELVKKRRFFDSICHT